MQVIGHLNQQQQMEILNKAAFFSRFSGDERKILLLHGPELIAYVEKEWVIEEGDNSDASLYVVLNGDLSVWKDGQQIATLGRGHCFGEVSFLSGKPRTGSVQCESKVALFKLKREHMNRLPVTAREKIKDNLISIMLNRLETGQAAHGTSAPPDGSDPLG